jgi:hypothetical protein
VRLAVNHVPLESFARTRELGFSIARYEPAQSATDDELHQAIGAFTVPDAPGLWFLAPGPPPPGDDLSRLTHMCQLAAASGVPIAIEIGNEPDLPWDGIADITNDPARYAEWVDACYVSIRQVNPTVAILAGGVSGPHDRGLAFLDGARAGDWPAEIVCAVHRYPREDWPAKWSPEGAVMVAHKGFLSREEEWIELKGIIGAARRIWIGEHGLHSSPRDVGIWQESWSDSQIAREMTIDLHWFASHGVEVAAVYQYGDADPTIYDPDNRLHTFGVLYGDGTAKPVASSFQSFAGLTETRQS